MVHRHGIKKFLWKKGIQSINGATKRALIQIERKKERKKERTKKVVKTKINEKGEKDEQQFPLLLLAAPFHSWRTKL